MSAQLGLEQARKMQGESRQFNITDYIQRTLLFMAEEEDGRTTAAKDDNVEAHAPDLNWQKLGRLAMRHMRTPPVLSFMLGPLAVERKARKIQRQKTERKLESTLVRPDEVCCVVWFEV